MRDSYDDSSQRSREDGLRRLGRLTWRISQLGALATVGFAIVFARAAPAQTAGNDTAPPATPGTAAPTGSHHSLRATPAGGSSVATRSAAARNAAGAAPSAAPAAQPAAQPSAAPVTRATPTLAPPSTAPAPAPATSSPATTSTSSSHGGN